MAHMKKLTVILALLVLLAGISGCIPADPTPTDPALNNPIPTGPDPTDPDPTDQEPTGGEKKFITSEEVDLRQMVVDYMYAMASVEWTAGPLLDYSGYGAGNLIYEPGNTYLGMVYNNTATGLEMFLSVLDGNGQYTSTEINWNTAPGNSCATSIEHAWQQISPTVEYGYSADMMPCFRYSGVVAIGNIDWSVYDRTHTQTAIQGNKREDILEAYALTLPGDALVRHLGDAGGHALMITKTPTVVRNSDGSINPDESYMYLTEQNNYLNNSRGYPSSWSLDMPVSFSDALNGYYLPVTVAELRDGVTEAPWFEVTGGPAAETLASGTLTGSVESNYCMNTVRIEIMCGESMVACATAYPYTRSFSFGQLSDPLNIADLPTGEYTMIITAEVGLETKTLVETYFSK